MEKYQLKQLRSDLPHGAYYEIMSRLSKKYSYSMIANVMNGRGVNLDIINTAIDIANEYQDKLQNTKNKLNERTSNRPAPSGKRKTRSAA